MKEAGIPIERKNILDGYVSYDFGQEAAKKIAEDRTITAVFATSDIAAMGMINGLKELGISVPEDVSVIGFDDVDYAKMCFPGLTTIRQNIFEKGKQAAQLMITAAENHNLPHEERTIPICVVERGTVKELSWK